MRLLPLLLVVAALSACERQAAAQQRHALLVGVSAYPTQQNRDLIGPKNDVQLMRRVLAERGFAPQNVTVLADGVPGGGEPTRRAIVAALEALAGKAAKGDFVFLLFAGHGSQQPARGIGPSNPEPDGLDETFLPRDIGRWEDSTATVENAIVDDEFDAMIGAIRNKGAFVWAVFDSCHSGTVTRGVDDPEVRYRELKPADLGVPRAALERAQAEAKKALPATRGAPAPGGALNKTGKLEAGAGGFVAFYAVQSNELEKEQRLPEGHPERQSHGRLTFTLAQVLAMNPGITYRQAGQQMLQVYAAANYFDTTPLFEGPSLDARVFQDKPAPRVMQWRLARDGGALKIEAGAVHQIAEGAVFALMPDAGAPDDKALGYAAAAKVQLYQAMLQPVERAGKPKLDPAQLPASAFARLVDANLSLAVRIALPPPAKAPGRHDAKARAVLERLARGPIPGLRAQWTSPRDGGDIRLLVRDDKLWLLPPGGELILAGPAKTHSIDLAANSEREIADKLVETLRAAAKVINLVRLASQTSGSAVGRAVGIDVQLKRGAKRVPLDVASVPRLRHDDEIEVQVRNGHTRGVYVSMFAIASDFAISQEYPQAGRNVPIEPGAKPFLLETLRISAEQTAGNEALFFIVTETQPGGEPPDFSFLAQKGVERTRGASGGGDLMEALQTIGFEPERARGASVSRATAERTAMRLFRFVTLPGAAGGRK